MKINIVKEIKENKMITMNWRDPKEELPKDKELCVVYGKLKPEYIIDIIPEYIISTIMYDDFIFKEMETTVNHYYKVLAWMPFSEIIVPPLKSTCRYEKFDIKGD